MPYPKLKNPYQQLGQSSRFQPVKKLQQSSRFQPTIQPAIKTAIDPIQEKKFLGIEQSVWKQLPRGLVDVFKDIGKPLEIDVPKEITNPKEIATYTQLKRGELGFEKASKLLKEIGLGITGRLFSLPAELIALTSDEFEMPSEFKIPFTNETVPTLSGIYRQYKEMGGSDALATLAMLGVASGDALIVGYGVSALKPKTNLPATKAQLKTKEPLLTELTYDDLVNITAGRNLSSAKLEAFKTLSREGVNWTNLLKARNQINPATGKPFTIKEAYQKGWGFKPGFIQPAEFKGLDIYKGATPQAKSMAGVGVGAGIGSGIINTVNPTGGVFTNYTPQQRATAELADNITTLDKTTGKSADEIITVYRGVPSDIDEIVAGDFITTNKQLAKDYAGNGNVVEKKVKLSEVLDDITEPLGEEYIYRPKSTPLKSDNLIQEASKYKTADDFIKAQGTPVYHGTNYKKFEPTKAISKDGLYGKGVYFASNKDVTKQYGNKTIEAFLDESSLLKIDKPLTPQQQVNLKKVMGKDEWDWSKNPTGDFVWNRLKLTHKNPEEILKKAGIKGIQHEQFVEGGKNINYTIFDPSVIKTKSQLTDIWNKAQEFLRKTKEGSITPAEFNRPIKSNIKASARAVNSIKTVLGNIKAVDPKNKGLIEELLGEIAYRINPKGDLVPAIRAKSGIYAPKEFEVYPFKDIGSKDLNFLNFAGAIDNLTADKGAGPMLQMAFEHNKLLADRNEFNTITNSEISKILENNKMLDLFGKPKAKDGEIVYQLLEGKTPTEATNAHKAVAKQLRIKLDELRDKANKVRVASGKAEIGYIENYAPHIQKTSLWQDLLGDKQTTISDNFDFIIPNRINASYFKKRYGLIEKKETNIFKLLDGYTSAISNDIYVSPMIEQLKAVNSVLAGRELMNANNFINRYIRENLVRKPSTIDNYVGLKPGSAKRNIVGRLIQARNLGALAGNIIWSIATQPASLGLTAMETGGKNLFLGAIKYYGSKSLRAQINNLPGLRLKSKTGIGTTLGGDIDRITGKIYKTKIDNWNDFTGLLGNVLEKQLTGISASAGYLKGKEFGLSGKELDIYADYIGQVTQSMYNPEARPLALNSMLVRLGFPFQTYAFEVWRHINTLGGKTKGIPKTKKQRAISVMNLIVATFIINYLHKKIRGRKLQTIGSFIPFVGSFIDDQITKLTKEKYQSGRAPIAPLEDIDKIREAIKSAIDDGDLRKLRRELIFWSLGMGGIGGAGQINRIIDGIIATEKGYVENIKGERLFDIKGWDAVFSPIVGPYGTSAGIKFLKDGQQTGYESIDELRTKIQKMYDNGDFATDEIAANYILGEIKKREDRIERIILTYNEDEFRDTIKTLISEGEISEERASKMILKYIDKYTKEEAEEEKDSNPRNIYQLAPDEETAISQIVKYAQAIGTDPVKAFDLLLKKEQVRKLNNGAIIVHRLPLEESEALKNKMGVTSKIKDSYKLDHTIPLQLGGDNTEGNLRLVTTEDWASYTPVENFLGKKLRDGEIGGSKILGIRVSGVGKITLKEAQKLLKDFKDGKITAEDIYNKF